MSRFKRASRCKTYKFAGYCHVVCPLAFRLSRRHEVAEHFPRLERLGFLHEVVARAIWAYRRFARSTAYVEKLLAGRGLW